MPDLLTASLAELVGELQSRGKASLIAIVPKVQRDTDNPDDNIDLFTDGCNQDKSWLLTALQVSVLEELRSALTPHGEEPDGDD